MLLYIPVLSFLCAALLAVFLPVQRINSNVANLSLVSWLFACNIIHGVNAVAWADNIDIHMPVWCDIMTKVRLGANVALPASCICLAMQLELVSSARPMPKTPDARRLRFLLEFCLCYIVPIIYMCLHFISQDRRFSIVRNFGPFASVHPSTPGIVLTWVPPLIFCLAGIIFCAISIHHSFNFTPYNFTAHLESRVPMNMSLFVRRLATTLTTTAVLTIVNLFSVFAPPDIVSWTSWDEVHAKFSKVKIVANADEVRSLELTWWAIPIVSLVYIFLSFAIGEEMKYILKWFISTAIAIRNYHWKDAVRLPLHRRAKRNEGASRPGSVACPQHTSPTMIELRSGWDDMLNKSAKGPHNMSKSPVSGKSTNISSSSRSPSAASCNAAEEDAFMKSTISYLGSPTAQTLGLPSPLAISPSHVHAPSPAPPSPTRKDDGAGQELEYIRPFPQVVTTIIPSTPTPPPTTQVKYPQIVLDDAVSTISSLMDAAAWPQPPSRLSSARSDSSVSSYPLDDDRSGKYSHRRSTTPPPFEGSITASPPLPPRRTSSLQVKVVPLNITSKIGKQTIRHGARRALSRDHSRPGTPQSDIIYMTVVKETETV